MIRRLGLVLAAAVLGLTACSEIGQEIDQATNEAAARALEAAVRDRLADANIELRGDPECTTDLDRDGTALTGTAECAGTTTDGQSATASFDGTLSTQDCDGRLIVKIEGRNVVDTTDIAGCSVE
ncbi:MAG: hypothetical protein ICV70_04410 [Jiangellaceae bacterium]|nr:hypothetical protein [Jiangellaceae bacterium]